MKPFSFSVRLNDHLALQGAFLLSHGFVGILRTYTYGVLRNGSSGHV